VCEMPEEMTVNVSLNLRDFLFVRSMPHHPVFSILRNTLIITVVAQAALMLIVPGISWMSFALWLPFYPVLYLLLSLSLYKRYRKELVSKITLTPDHIIGKTSGGSEGIYEWRVVQKIIQKHKAVAIQVCQKPDAYFWIPNRFFQTPQDADRFYLQAKEYWENLRFAALPDLFHTAPIADDLHGADVNLSVSELLACNYFLLKRFVVIGLLVLIAGVFGFLYLNSVQILLMSGLYSLLCIAYPAIFTQRIVKSHRDWLSGRILITPSELITEGKESGMFSHISWSKIKKVKRFNKILLLTLDTDWSVCVPLRCFTTVSAADEFCKLAANYQQEARPG
jgi:hypothetical protein